jgi:hypothetical protein
MFEPDGPHRNVVCGFNALSHVRIYGLHKRRAVFRHYSSSVRQFLC